MVPLLVFCMCTKLPTFKLYKSVLVVLELHGVAVSSRSKAGYVHGTIGQTALICGFRTPLTMCFFCLWEKYS